MMNDDRMVLRWEDDAGCLRRETIAYPVDGAIRVHHDEQWWNAIGEQWEHVGDHPWDTVYSLADDGETVAYAGMPWREWAVDYHVRGVRNRTYYRDVTVTEDDATNGWETDNVEK
jgi:hypothetical protein